MAYTGTDFTKSAVEEQALEVLKFMQARDYEMLSKQMDMAKDEVVKDLSFARLALTIPEDHYEVVSLAFPDIQSSDAEIKTAAWAQFMRHDISLPYKINVLQRSM